MRHQNIQRAVKSALLSPLPPAVLAEAGGARHYVANSGSRTMRRTQTRLGAEAASTRNPTSRPIRLDRSPSNANSAPCGRTGCALRRIGDVPHRHLGADKASRMDHRPQLCPLGDTEGQSVLRMGMNDSDDIRPRREDRRMDEALEIKAAVLVPHRLTVQVELDDVLGAHQLRSERPGDQEAVG